MPKSETDALDSLFEKGKGKLSVHEEDAAQFLVRVIADHRTALCLSAPAAVPNTHLTVFVEGEDLVALVTDETQPRGTLAPARRHSAARLARSRVR